MLQRGCANLSASSAMFHFLVATLLVTSRHAIPRDIFFLRHLTRAATTGVKPSFNPRLLTFDFNYCDTTEHKREQSTCWQKKKEKKKKRMKKKLPAESALYTLMDCKHALYGLNIFFSNPPRAITQLSKRAVIKKSDS